MLCGGFEMLSIGIIDRGAEVGISRGRTEWEGSMRFEKCSKCRIDINIG